ETTVEVEAESFIAVKSYKARGKRLAATEIVSVEWLEPLRREEPETIDVPEEEDSGEQVEESIFEWLVTPEAEAVQKEEAAGTPGKTKTSLVKKITRPDSQIKPGDREKQIRLDLDV
ncbi:MAG TPA: hypothetical protein VLH61_03835, partial [Bacteroidales bacterium]|nr:hypothetical protein [Bacteroidales bacterium]